MARKQVTDLPNMTADEWLAAMVEAYDFDNDPAGTELVKAATQQLRRMEQCRSEIAQSGPFISDRFGQRIAHPALKCERDAAGQFRSLVKSLALDDDDEGGGNGKA